jgi:hypothetical protein
MLLRSVVILVRLLERDDLGAPPLVRQLSFAWVMCGTVASPVPSPLANKPIGHSYFSITA